MKIKVNVLRKIHGFGEIFLVINYKNNKKILLIMVGY